MKRNKIQPKVTIVGAGPGDPDLISVKGLRALTGADVVLYDALVNKELLKYVPLQAKKIYVGKRADDHRYSQDEINKLIVENALNFGHVVRLKGGDPFVFGRGHEELTFTEALGIEVSIVPGITSAISVPELQKIPVTKRGINESFWVITGTTRNGELSKDIELAAQSSATIIILMGMRKLAQIADVFQNFGKGNAPIAIIQNGSLPTENVGFGRINNIVKVAEEEQLGAPAIIVIGDVVKEHPDVNYEFLDRNYLQSNLSKN
jgi:uroporphyrin-III C-methyltransferase